MSKTYGYTVSILLKIFFHSEKSLILVKPLLSGNCKTHFINRMKKLYAVLIFIILQSHGTAQNESQNWFFGGGAGLSFSTSPPTPLFGNNLFISEGCASISDGAGNLLFYTDGIFVKNKTHATMANGTGLQGNSSSTQSGVIVKQPGNANMYYIFTADANGNANGIKYSIVDMALAAGMGSVTIKNAPLYSPALEKIVAIKHANGNDVWMISHELNTSNFVAYLLTSAGVNATPVLTPIGAVHGTQNWCGYLKASPNGKKIGMASYFNPSSMAAMPSVELFDFNKATGVVSNSLTLSNDGYAYGCEFSPDGTKFYVAQWLGAGGIFQWDLCAGSNNAILASQYTVTPGVGIGNGKGALQVASDGKMYVARPSQQFLDIIQNPNVAGAGCNYVTPGISLAPSSSQYGLPNFTPDQATPVSYTISACNTIGFASPIWGNTTIGNWNFGDPSTGAANTSTLANPVHVFSGPGTYTVRLIVSSCAGLDTLYAQVTNTNALLQVSSSPSATICIGQSCTLTATGANSYTWSNTATGSVTTITPTASGIYSLSGIGSNSCIASTLFTLNVNPKPVVAITGPTLVCKGNKAVLTATGAATYTWSTNALTPTISTTPTSTNTITYTVTGTSTLGCVNTNTFALAISPCTALQENDPVNRFSVYPNPATGDLFVCSPVKGELGIYDINGSLQLQAAVPEGDSVIDLRPLSSGIYFLRYTTTAGTKEIRLVKTGD
jgi:PKD repeat protein